LFLIDHFVASVEVVAALAEQQQRLNFCLRQANDMIAENFQGNDEGSKPKLNMIGTLL
jgi:hypothetical protein